MNFSMPRFLPVSWKPRSFRPLVTHIGSVSTLGMAFSPRYDLHMVESQRPTPDCVVFDVTRRFKIFSRGSPRGQFPPSVPPQRQIPADADRQREAEADGRAKLQRRDMEHRDRDAQAQQAP